MRKILIFLMICICSVAMTACGGKESTSGKGNQGEPDSETYYTVTFIQENQEDIVKSVKEGESLTDVPTPVAIPGYDVNWNQTDFTNITANITVNAVKTVKTFTLKFSLGTAEKETGAQISTTITKVEYNQSFEFPTVSCPGFDFVAWVVKGTDTVVTEMTYTFTTDVVLVATWEIDEDDPFWWSPEV